MLEPHTFYTLSTYCY